MSAPDDDDLFRDAMAGVTPIEKRERVGVAPTRTSRPVPKQLPTFTVEGDTGVGYGVSRRQLEQLRSGKIAIDARVDLHGQTGEVARDTVSQRVRSAAEAGARCVLIIHGRGAVLRDVAVETLTGPALARVVLAYCPARPQDGGAGAMYVLLRR